MILGYIFKHTKTVYYMDNIKKLIKTMGINAAKIRTFKQGYVSNVYLIETNNDTIVLKKYKFTRKTKDILSELKLLHHLHKRGFPVPKPIKIKDKEIINFEKTKFVFFEYLPGKKRNPNKLSKKEITNLIFVIANMHNSTENIKISYIKDRRDMFTFNFEDFVIDFAKKNNFTLSSDMKKMIYIKDRLKLQILPKIKLFKEIIIHNDLSIGNLKFKNNKISAILDFDDFCIGSRISDLSNLLIDLCTDVDSIDFNKVSKYLKIYEKTNELTKDELEIINLLLLHRLSMYIYFHYFNYLISNSNIQLKKSKHYFKVLNNSLKKLKYGSITSCKL